jgi:tRNA A-37 threonylcarbamoyl transferase component Bud32
VLEEPLPPFGNHFENFQPVMDSDIAGVVRRDAIAWLGDFRHVFCDVTGSPGTVLRKGGGQSVTSRREFNGQTVYCKVYRSDRLHRRLRDRLIGFRCFREWHANCLVNEAGIATAPIVAALAQRRGFSTLQLVISEPASGRSVAHWLEGRPGALPNRAAFLAALAGFLARLHGVGVFHPHLHAKHIFTVDGHTFSLIDLDRATICQPLPVWRRRYNLSQMRTSLKRLGTDDDARHFEREYWIACGLPAEQMPVRDICCQIVSATVTFAHGIFPAWRTHKVLHSQDAHRANSAK